MMHNSDNYFIIISRSVPDSIPFSVYEIYTIINDGLVNVYDTIFEDVYHYVKPDLVLTEDTNSGHDFFERVCSKCAIPCYSLGGKSKINSPDGTIEILNYAVNYKNIAIIVDGAAFGSNIFNFLSIRDEALYTLNSKMVLFTPESFEYLLLNTNAVQADSSVLKNTYDYHDAETLNRMFLNAGFKEPVLSWEQFYTKYLSQISPVGYNKNKLNEYFFRYERNVLNQLSDLGIG